MPSHPSVSRVSVSKWFGQVAALFYIALWRDTLSRCPVTDSCSLFLFPLSLRPVGFLGNLFQKMAWKCVYVHERNYLWGLITQQDSGTFRWCPCGLKWWTSQSLPPVISVFVISCNSCRRYRLENATLSSNGFWGSVGSSMILCDQA